MAEIPKLLLVKHLDNPDAGAASAEAFGNAHRLVQAGRLDAAHEVVTALLARGAWRMSPKSPHWIPAWYLATWLAHHLQRPAPDASRDGEYAAHGVQWATTESAKPFGVNPSHFKPITWSDAELAARTARVQPGQDLRDDFRLRASEELRRRLCARLDGKRDDDGRHGAIADALEAQTGIEDPKRVAEYDFEHALHTALIDLLDGARDAAIERLARYLPKRTADDFKETNARRLPAYLDLLRSGAFARALGIDDAGVDAYLAAFRARSPFTVRRPPPKPWPDVLKAWAKAQKEDGIDTAEVQDTVSAGLPLAKALLAGAKKGRTQPAGASVDDLATLEACIGMTLPPSYRDFLLAANGLVLPGFVTLLPAQDVAWLRDLDPDTVQAWTSDADDATDEEYATYGADQDPGAMRAAHLQHALQVSTSVDGDVLLLVPTVRDGDEWEAWWLGAKTPGAYRGRSFRELMELRVLVADRG